MVTVKGKKTKQHLFAIDIENQFHTGWHQPTIKRIYLESKARNLQSELFLHADLILNIIHQYLSSWHSFPVSSFKWQHQEKYCGQTVFTVQSLKWKSKASNLVFKCEVHTILKTQGRQQQKSKMIKFHFIPWSFTNLPHSILQGRETEQGTFH